MTFDEAEARFRELQARVQRGEPISRAEYEDQVSQLAVQDDRGVLWEINPRTGKWMYFDGAEWVGGIPPGRDTSTVMPLPRGPGTPSGVSAPSARPAPTPAATTSAPPVAAPPSANMAPMSPRTSASPAPRTTVPMTTSPRPITPPSTAAPPRGSPPSPEAVPPYRRVGPEQTGGAPPGAPAGEGVPKRGARQGPLGGPNREWVPLAIGAVVLLFCAMLLFVVGRLAFGGGVAGLFSAATPTRPAAVALATNTPVPTVVRLPTQPPPPASPAPVIAKVIEASVNVRATPSTSAKILSKLKKDNTISLTGRSVDGKWYQATIQNLTAPAWVFAETLQIASGDPNTLPLAGPGAPTATKPAAPAPGSGAAATPTIIGARP